MADLEHVCNDLDGTSPWHYSPEEKAYYRCYDEGKHQGKILGQFLPNPDVLWNMRKDVIRKVKGSVSGEDMNRVKPGATTFQSLATLAEKGR